jgi:tripartite-type tricarboxylate transporter receptor subunit TctC
MERDGAAWRVQKPYKGTSGVLSDLVGNHVSAMFVPTHVALPLAADRQIRILGVASAERVAAAPEVPTLAEQGVTGFEVDIWFGLLARPERWRTWLNATTPRSTRFCVPRRSQGHWPGRD